MFLLMFQMFHPLLFVQKYERESWGGILFLLPLHLYRRRTWLAARPCLAEDNSDKNMKETKADLIADYYSQHYDELKAYVVSRLQCAKDAEDIVQDVFVRLLQLDKMITPVTLPCLVYTVARNLTFDRLRHYQCVCDYGHYLSHAGLSHAVYDAESVYSAWEINEVLERGIARLGEKQGQVYRLNLYDGLPVSEIAVRLDIKYKNVENRLGVARKQVRSYVRRMLA